jgi:hypothetical protein
MDDEEKLLQYKKEWYKNNREKVLIKRHAYYINNKYKIKQYLKKNKKYLKEKRQKEHKQYMILLHDLKINGCAICGYDKCDAVLQFHHVNPKDKLFSLHSQGSRKKETIIKEVNKCILLCFNCHMELHYGDK